MKQTIFPALGIWSTRSFIRRALIRRFFVYFPIVVAINPAKMSAIVQSRIAQTGHTPALKDLVKYLAYYRKNVMEKGDNPPVGILMCTKAGKELVVYPLRPSRTSAGV